MSLDLSPFAIKIGHASDTRLKSGTTVLLPDQAMVGSVFVMGGGPGGRETDLLEPHNTVESIDAIVLSGGSVFGLAAADGATGWLAEHNRGFDTGTMKVPIVPAAVLFDLANGGDKSSVPGQAASGSPNPYHELGRRACAAAGRKTGLGSIGAGTGATTANLRGGFGAASSHLRTGGMVLAVAAVNAVGSAIIGDGGHFRAGAFEHGNEFGGLGFPDAPLDNEFTPLTKVDAAPATNTTIAVIVTNLALTKSQCKRIALSAHDGLGLSIFPAHTPFDGDTIFVLSSGEVPMSDPIRQMTDLTGAAAMTLARAVALGVYHAAPDPDGTLGTWQEKFR